MRAGPLEARGVSHQANWLQTRAAVSRNRVWVGIGFGRAEHPDALRRGGLPVGGAHWAGPVIEPLWPRWGDSASQGANKMHTSGIECLGPQACGILFNENPKGFAGSGDRERERREAGLVPAHWP